MRALLHAEEPHRQLQHTLDTFQFWERSSWADEVTAIHISPFWFATSRWRGSAALVLCWAAVSASCDVQLDDGRRPALPAAPQSATSHQSRSAQNLVIITQPVSSSPAFFPDT